MESVEWIALSALILTLLLLLKVFSLQRQLNELKSDLQVSERLHEVTRSASTHSSLNKAYPSPGTTSFSPPANLDDRLRILAASGKRIQAIKEFREATNVGLREAKEYVDRLTGK